MFKNIVTAVATSVSATFIARASQVHQTYLVHNLSGENHMFHYKLMAAQAKFSTYFSPYIAAKKAGGSLYNQMLVQAKLYSFFDAFQILAFMCLIIIPLVIVLKNKSLRKKKAQV